MIDMIELRTLDIQRSRKKVSVQFFWCPQECVEPHETADHLSKMVRFGGGSGTESKALNMLNSLTHSDIRSALEQAHRDANQSDADDSTATSIPATADGHDIIRSAARHLSAAHQEMMLAAAKLEEMANALQAATQAQNQVQDSDGQVHNSTDQGIEGGDHTVEPEDEDIFYDAHEQGESKEGDVDGELAVAGDGTGRLSRARALWDWMRGRPRL